MLQEKQAKRLKREVKKLKLALSKPEQIHFVEEITSPESIEPEPGPEPLFDHSREAELLQKLQEAEERIEHVESVRVQAEEREMVTRRELEHASLLSLSRFWLVFQFCDPVSRAEVSEQRVIELEKLLEAANAPKSDKQLKKLQKELKKTTEQLAETSVCIHRGLRPTKKTKFYFLTFFAILGN